MVKTKRRKTVKKFIFSLLVMTTIESVVKNKILPALLIPLKWLEIVTFRLRVLLCYCERLSCVKVKKSAVSHWQPLKYDYDCGHAQLEQIVCLFRKKAWRFYLFMLKNLFLFFLVNWLLHNISCILNNWRIILVLVR